MRRQTEGFGTATDADLDRIRRSTVGFNVGQFHPELNPLGLNTVQFREVFRALRFDAAGNQVDRNFGKASRSRNPRVMQVSLRFTF
ncbi:MAG: hypothetical protein HY654_01265 [Acidobacteria bacterium]|nr:hypothetical protein [Acidobacteriota bacterium]